ncbi:MAG: primase, partial [Frankiales bacterium]|nr:primase [Frankiales bacterium]
PVTVASLGDWLLTTGPGEEFSNLSNTIKEKHPDQVVFPVSQANDALGYMPQSFEIDPVGQQGLGFALGGYVFVNYEDSYAIDACVGDGVLEETLAALSKLK